MAAARTWTLPALACCALLGACASGPETCTRDMVTGSDRCFRSSSDPTEAVITAGAATVAWAAVGCTVNDCEPPFRCNGETKMCERIRCDEGSNPCPPAYQCDLEDHVCR